MFVVYIPYVFNTTTKDIITESIKEFMPDAIIQDVDLQTRNNHKTGISYFIAFVKFEHIGHTIKHIILQGRQIDVPVYSPATKQTHIHLKNYLPKPTPVTTPSIPTYAQALTASITTPTQTITTPVLPPTQTITTPTQTITAPTLPPTPSITAPTLPPSLPTEQHNITYIPIEQRIAILEHSLAQLYSFNQHLLHSFTHIQHDFILLQDFVTEHDFAFEISAMENQDDEPSV
jgi:hypothetical protein